MHKARMIGLGIVFAWFFGGGIGHFVMTEFFVSIVPPYIPWPLAAVYVTGVLELLGAIGVLIPTTRRLAGLGLIVLTLGVSLANIHMWLHPELFPQFPEWTLSLRLVTQVLLIVCIGWSTRTPASSGRT